MNIYACIWAYIPAYDPSCTHAIKECIWVLILLGMPAFLVSKKKKQTLNI